jgi:hypothetical protein
MNSQVVRRVSRLADSLAELKVKLRTALATELAGAVGIAVRDVLIAALIDGLVTASPRQTPGWRSDGYERERRSWDDEDPWSDPDDYRYARSTTTHADRGSPEPVVTLPVAAAAAIGVNVGRWWLARSGSVAGAVGIGVLATTLGLGSGPFTRVALTVLAAAADLLTAESLLKTTDLP